MRHFRSGLIPGLWPIYGPGAQLALPL